MFGNSYVLMDGDGGDSGGGGGGGGLTGGRGSSVAERPQTSGERFGANVISKGAGLLGSAIGGPLLGQAFSRGASSITGGPVQIDLRTGQRTNISSGNEAFQRSLSADSAGDRRFQTFGGFGGPGGSSNTGGRNVASAADIAINRALGFTQAGEARALESIAPFAETGRQALDRQSAFLGLQGAEAEQAALAGFTQSPGAQFAQQEEEQAIVRNALALGDAGGGRVKDELATRASGRFGQRLDTRLLQLNRLSGSGQSAAFGEAGIQQEAGANQAQAVLGQQVSAATAASEANRIAALREQQQSSQDAAFQSQLFGLGASIAKPFISSFF